MSRFAIQLNGILTTLGWSKSELARRLNKSPSSIQPYLDSSYRPTRELLVQLSHVMDKPHFVRALIAHLGDEVPEEFDDAISIKAAGMVVNESPDAVFSELPAELQATFVFLAKKALKSKAVQAAILSQADLLR